MGDQLWQWDATRLASAIRTREVSCTEAMTSVVARIRAVNPSLNAITVDGTDAALAAAAAADAALAAGAVTPGPLFGVPFTIKENVDVAGQATPNGLPVLADLIAPDDSPVVANLRRAGGLLVGRTNTPEVSMRATTWNPLRGRTWNPWDPDASAGGSSGGAGSAAAAGMGPLHHGNDIGGSLRFPSFCNGVTSIKPTQGRVPAFNPSATAERPLLSLLMSTQGVIARSVADVRLGTEVMAQADPRDPWWVPAPWVGPSPDGPIRVAVARDGHGYPVHPGIASLLERSAAHLADAGYEIVDEAPPPIIDAARLWFSAGTTEMRYSLDPVVRAYGSEELQRVFDTYFAMGEVLDLPGYVTALGTRTGLLRRWTTFLDRVPLVLTPFCLRPTYRHDVDTTVDGARDLLEAAIYSYGLNVLGLPAGVVPVDLVDGLPAGVQIVGPRFREDLVLEAMGAVEARAGRLVEQLWAREDAPPA
jgi:amidase